ncbi:MAG: Sapep family Mn(2+)-dependent dipeptidase [Clostridia bacterium]|nr:Sapep family Mn(2+)-dependent dipeptidase [Clostridia bacterium]
MFIKGVKTVQYFESALCALKDWIKIKSVKSAPQTNMPLGAGVYEMAKTCYEHALSLGLNAIYYDGYAVEVTLGDGSDEDGVSVLCHLDVVPEGDLSLWNSNPFTLTEENGYLVGRGVVDDKGPAVLCLYALKELKDQGFKPSKKIKLIFGMDEESGWDCIEHYKKVATLSTVGFSPDGDFPVIYAEKGIIHIEYTFKKHPLIEKLVGGDRINVVCDKVNLTFYGNDYLFTGVSAHGSTPEKGDNAIKKALEFLVQNNAFDIKDYNALFLNKELSSVSDESGVLTFSPNVITANENGIFIKTDVRYPVTYLRENIEKLLGKVGNFKVLSHQPALYANKNGKLVKTLLKVYENCFNEKGTPITTGGGTYARALKNGVAFGPSLYGEHCCHVPNEKISIERLKKCYKAYKQAIYELAK